MTKVQLLRNWKQKTGPAPLSHIRSKSICDSPFILLKFFLVRLHRRCWFLGTNIEARLSSFKDWPAEFKIQPEELAEAGFYHCPLETQPYQVMMR